MIRKVLSKWVEWVAGRLGPWNLCGIERLPGETRYVRLQRGWKGWRVGTWRTENAFDFSIERREISHGYHCLLGNVPILFKNSMSELEWDAINLDSPSYIECNPSWGWPFLWRGDKLVQVLGEEQPCTTGLSGSLLLAMLAPGHLPEHWIAVRFLRESAMVWFLDGCDLQRFVNLSGGTSDPVLLEQEWNQLLSQDLPQQLPNHVGVPIAVLETTDHERTDRMLASQQEMLFAPPWLPQFELVPEPIRFAAAAAQLHRCGHVIEDNPYGWEAQLRMGRRSAAMGLMAGAALLGLAGCIELGFAGNQFRLDRNIAASSNQLAKNAKRVELVLTWQKAEEQNKLRIREFMKLGGRLSGAMVSGVSCLNGPVRVVSWEGQRFDDGFRQTLVVKTVGDANLGHWTTCLSGAFVGPSFRVQMTESGRDVNPDEKTVVTLGSGLLP